MKVGQIVYYLYWNLGGDFYLDECKLEKIEPSKGITIKVVDNILSNQPPTAGREIGFTFLTDEDKVCTREEAISLMLKFKNHIDGYKKTGGSPIA